MDIIVRIFLIIFILSSCSQQNEMEINVGILNRPLNLKSYEIRDGVSTIVGHQIHRGLLQYHHETGQVVSYAAKDWQYSDDYKSLIFTLDTSIKFHDGTDLNCRYVLDSFNNLLINKSSTSIKFPKSVKFKCDKQKFIMSMDTIPSTIFETLASPAASISKGINNDIGIGPYKIVKMMDKSIHLEKVDFPKHKLNFIIDKRDNLIRKFKANMIDDLLYLGLFEDLKIDCKKVVSYTPTTFWINLNTSMPILNSKINRNLIYNFFLLGIDKSKIFENENKLNGLIPYGVLGHNQEVSKTNSKLSLKEIQIILKKLTSKQGKIKLTLRKVNENMYNWDKLVTILDPDKSIFDVEYLDNPMFFKLYYQNKLSMFFIGANITRNDPFEVFSFFRPDDKVNPASVKKDEISKLEEKYIQSTSIAERKLLAKKANEWLLSESYIIPLFSKKLSGCVNKNLKGISISPVGPLMIDYSRVEKDGL